MSKHEVQVLWDVGAQLGEGPVWVEEQQRLYFVDLKSKNLHALDIDSGARHAWEMPDYVCWLIARRDGDGFMAGLRDGIARVWLEPELRIEYIARPFPAGSALRMNDAKVDRQGRIWAGSMHNTDYAQAVGALFRLDTDLNLTVADDGYHICNGPTFIDGGATMLHTDSFEGRIYAYPLADDGALGEPAVWRQLGDDEGSPDGMTVDSEGCVWVAQWGGARVCRYSPKGELLDTIAVPALNPTSCTFGGPDFQTLFITTACEGNTPEQLKEFPLSGALFAVHVDVHGLPAGRFG